jgi:hypothetical protein
MQTVLVKIMDLFLLQKEIKKEKTTEDFLFPVFFTSCFLQH